MQSAVAILASATGAVNWLVFLLKTVITCRHLLLLPLLYILNGLIGRIIILIQVSHSEELVVLHTYLRLAKVRRFVSCCVRLSMLVWFSPLASHTLPVKITWPSGTTFITKPANLDSELHYSSFNMPFLLIVIIFTTMDGLVSAIRWPKLTADNKAKMIKRLLK